MKKTVALYGGAFNPPTNAHLSIAKGLLWEFDEVWIIPSYNQVQEKDVIDFGHRIKMCKLMIKDPRMKVLDIERKIKPRNTHELVKMFLKCKKYKDYIFYFVIGLDQANLFHVWENNEILKKELPFVIVPRSGHRIQGIMWYMEEPHHIMSAHEELNISSSMVRSLIEDNNLAAIKTLVPKKVYNYIKCHNLYNTEPYANF